MTTATEPKPDPKLELIPTTTVGETDLSDLYYNILLAGPPGSGKTHFISTCPDVFCLYIEENQASIRKFPGIRFVGIKSWAQFEQLALPALQRHSWYIQNAAGEAELANLTCRTFALDGASLLHSMCIEHYSQTYDKFKLWAMVLSKWTMALRILTRLSKPPNPCHVVVTCDTRDHENENGTVEKIAPAFAGQSAGLTPKPFDSRFLLSRRVLRENNAPLGKITGTENIMYTVNPDKRYDFVSDGVGGGQFATLPPTLPNTFQALEAAWKTQPKQPRGTKK